jgi:hypothetical protein
VERIIGAIGDPRSNAATFFDQANLTSAPKHLREMNCDHASSTGSPPVTTLINNRPLLF